MFEKFRKFEVQEAHLTTPNTCLAFFFYPVCVSQKKSSIAITIMGDANLFSDTFQVTAVNFFKYERVSRLTANTENGDTSLELDINAELFPCAVGDRLQLLIASTLSLDGSKDASKGWRDVGRDETSLADDYDYVCYGKCYRFEE